MSYFRTSLLPILLACTALGARVATAGAALREEASPSQGQSESTSDPGEIDRNYYVSPQGDDTAAGTSPEAAWKTVAKVNASTFLPKTAVRFLRGGVWHEQLNISSSGTADAYLTFGSYGPTSSELPVLDGADVVTGWTVERESTYKAPFTALAVKAFVDSLYTETVSLAAQSSVSLVLSTPGSIYSDGSHVYVHLSDGSNPAAHTIEVSGARHFVVYGIGQKFVTIDGLKIIRGAYSNVAWQSGGSNASKDTGGDYLTVQNSTIFNCGETHPAGTTDNILFSEACVIVQGANLAGQKGLQGIEIDHNSIGRFDYEGVPEPDAGRAGIILQGTQKASVTHNVIRTGKEGAVFLFNFFNNLNNRENYVGYNDISNSNENILFGSCMGCIAERNAIHDSHGTGIQVGGTGLPGSGGSVGVWLNYNDIWNLTPSLDRNKTSYNGIDCNAGSNGGTATGNRIRSVASASMTLEADGGPCSGWTLNGNIFDATRNVNYLGDVPTKAQPANSLYVRDASMAGLKMAGNTNLVNGTTSFVRFGATSSNDGTHNLTLPQFHSRTGVELHTPETAPSGTCPVSGVWVSSKDGHVALCSGGKWARQM